MSAGLGGIMMGMGMKHDVKKQKREQEWRGCQTVPTHELRPITEKAVKCFITLR